MAVLIIQSGTNSVVLLFQLHFLAGPRRSACDTNLCAAGHNGVHDRVLAYGQHLMPPHGVCQGRISGCLRVHIDRTLRRKILRHR